MEYFDVYDDERKLVGKTLEKGTKLEQGENRMVVHLCIFNSKGEMLIQQRQSFKKGWPNMWDITLGGNSQAGETSKQSVHRELLEELGIDYDFTNTRPHLTINFDNGFDDIYFLEMDLDVDKLKLQYEEVQAAKWASKDEILEMRKSGKFIPYFESFLSALFELKTKRGIY
ncbi:MAG: NUDIX domain-containing protein [Clostridia bacterium]|nr:NUDIX domain-containing protein [Clostridiales bacterium]MBQ7917962.1 NUDIX domain-containing protein [Clostridia bacterium]